MPDLDFSSEVMYNVHEDLVILGDGLHEPVLDLYLGLDNGLIYLALGPEPRAFRNAAVRRTEEDDSRNGIFNAGKVLRKRYGCVINL